MPYAYCEQIGKEIRDISDEIPFDIPDTWEWVRCSTLGAIIRGSGIKRTETVESGMPCVRYGELYTTYNTSFMETISFVSQELYEQCKQISNGDVLFTLTGENKPDIAKTVAYLGDSPVAVGGDLAFWTHHGMNPLYLVYFMSSPYAIGRKVNLATGDIIVHISGDKVGSILIPVPPLAEQDRIMAQINELEPIIQEYHSKEQAVSALNTSFPEALKKSILQEAVQGKLVPQNPDDEPASVLLERIRAEKQALIKTGKIKKDKHESVIITRDKVPYEIIDGKERCITDEVPFEIPDSWCWCRLGSISWFFDAGKSPNCIKQSVTGTEYGVITTTSIQLGYFDEQQNKVLPLSFDVKEEMKVNKGDILITRAGPMNRTGVACVVKDIHYNLILSDKTIRINMSDELFDKDYIVTVLNSPKIREQIIGLMSGMDKQQVNISQDKYKTVFIPLPPLAEQKRIVAKIEELMKYCDKL